MLRVRQIIELKESDGLTPRSVDILNTNFRNIASSSSQEFAVTDRTDAIERVASDAAAEAALANEKINDLNIFAHINGIDAHGNNDKIDFETGEGIKIVNDSLDKKITISSPGTPVISAVAPINPIANVSIWIDTTTNTLKYYNGVTWMSVN